MTSRENLVNEKNFEPSFSENSSQPPMYTAGNMGGATPGGSVNINVSVPNSQTQGKRGMFSHKYAKIGVVVGAFLLGVILCGLIAAIAFHVHRNERMRSKFEVI